MSTFIQPYTGQVKPEFLYVVVLEFSRQHWSRKAKKTNMSRSTINRTVRDDVQIKSFVLKSNVPYPTISSTICGPHLAQTAIP